jgi:hypothetical protein
MQMHHALYFQPCLDDHLCGVNWLAKRRHKGENIMRPLMRISLLVTLASAALFAPAPASATTFFLDSFTVELNGATLFQDDFADGLAPPAAPDYLFPGDNTAVSYSTLGTLFESNGKVLLDPINHGAASTNPLNQPVSVIRGRLPTPVDDTKTRNLGPTDTFSVSGVYDLVNPGSQTEQYRIRLTDLDPDRPREESNDFLFVTVQRKTDNQVYIRFGKGDFNENTSTVYGEIPIDLTGNPDQIRLSLAKLSTASNEITASFAYLKEGSEISNEVFSQTVPIFDGENFTRPDFQSQIVADFIGPSLAAKLVTGSPASLSQTIDTPASPQNLQFDYKFESTTGVLDVTINGTSIGTLAAPGTLSGAFSPASFLVSGLLLDLQDAILSFVLDGVAGSSILIDNVLFPGLINGDFQTGNLTGWNVQHSGAGSVAISEVPQVPLPAALPLLLGGLAGLGFLGRKARPHFARLA